MRCGRAGVLFVADDPRLLAKYLVQIGREIGCSIVLKDPTVSRFHADVRAEGGQFVLYAMGSSGTKVNGEPAVVPRLLREGDQIQMGDTTFTFSALPMPPGIRSVPGATVIQLADARGRPGCRLVRESARLLPCVIVM